MAQQVAMLVKRHAAACGSVFDVGCGRGYLLGLLRDNGFDAEGCDVNAEAIAEARWHGERVKELFFSPIIEPHAQFDALCFVDVFEHFPDPIGVLIATHKWLKPNGVVVLELPNVQSLYARLLGRQWWFGLEHCFYYSLEAVNRLAKQADFEVIAWESDNVNLLTLEGMCRLGFFGEDPVWGRTDTIELSWWHRLLGSLFRTWFGRIVNEFLNRWGQKRGLGDQLRIVLRIRPTA